MLEASPPPTATVPTSAKACDPPSCPPCAKSLPPLRWRLFSVLKTLWLLTIAPALIVMETGDAAPPKTLLRSKKRRPELLIVIVPACVP